jgi:phosphatidyl-myo-inositol dimannoside synthase
VADLFLMPSTGECFGSAFLEAMASGTPALGLAVAGARDALADGELGMAVAEDDLDGALSKARPDPQALASATRTRFGRKPFSASARMVIKRLLLEPHYSANSANRN